ncbi:hypothetical protein AYI70_g3363 [Smittium culicis]|uniref:Core-binding (CB) domain-containing protein n=1 Tax=Smittium culicis TaxID=133412 RepID=A0A1R1Y4D5_9FUNG|nr:hypothetical protein AYI70_g3363 [Smittium culicis]
MKRLYKLWVDYHYQEVTMYEDTMRFLTELNDKVNQLLVTTNAVQQPRGMTVEEEEDEHISNRVHIHNLTIYLRLLEALPSIGEDFYRSHLTEIDRRESIHSCTRTLGMEYSPPPINDTSPASSKKVDSTLYAIQVLLSQATRPIDYFVHRRLQEIPNIPADDEVFLFANTVRVLLSDIATFITQSRIDNIHQSMQLNGKAPQLTPSSKKPLIDPAVLTELVKEKNVTCPPRSRQPFRPRQQFPAYNAAQTSTRETATAPASTEAYTPNPQRAQTATHQVSCSFGSAHEQQMGARHRESWIFNPIHDPPSNEDPSLENQTQDGTVFNKNVNRRVICTASKESHCRNIHELSWILLQPIHDTQEDRGSKTGTGFERTEHSSREAKIQDGDIRIHMQIDSQEGLANIDRPGGCVPSYTNTQDLPKIPQVFMEWKALSVQGASIRTSLKSTSVHEDIETGTAMGEIIGDTNFSVLRRPSDNGGVETDMREKHRYGFKKIKGIGLPYKTIEFVSNPQSINPTPWNADKYSPCDSQGSTPESPGLETRSEKTDKLRKVNATSSCVIHRQGSGDVYSLVSRETNAATPNGAEKQLFIEYKGLEIDLEWNGQSFLPETPEMEIFTDASDMAWGIVVGSKSYYGLWSQSQKSLHINENELLTVLQYHYAFVRKKVWGDYFIKLIGDFRKAMVSLPGDQYSTTSHIYTINDEPCRCPVTPDSPDRMVNLVTNICSTRRCLWSTRCRSVCFSGERQGIKLLQLVSRHCSNRNQLPSTQLGSLEEPILIPALEYNSKCNPEGTKRTTDYNSGHTSMEISNLVSRSPEAIDCTAAPSSSNDDNSRSKKRKVPAYEEQEMVINGMEDQRSFLKSQGLEDTAINLIVSNERSAKRRSRYHSTQQRFLDWHISRNQSEPISAHHIVNYLAQEFTTKKLSVNTIKAYKSAIMSLIKNPQTIEDSTVFKSFFKALNESSVKSFVKPVIDITPVISKLSEWGDTEKLNISQLTSKTTWLLALCGFLRASDIHRIDDSRTSIINGTLRLVIIAPKEKRNGRPIERPCEIKSHSDPILCPVLSYKIYKTKVSSILCPRPHANGGNLIVNILFRHTVDHSKPLSVDSITRYIRMLSDLIPRPPNTPCPKARAIGATLAAAAGVPPDVIVSQAFWSNYTMFDSYYRLSRSTQSNLTEAVLPLE